MPLPSSLSDQQNTINMVQFVDFITSKSRNAREEAMEVFHNMDAEGDGMVEVTWLLAVSRLLFNSPLLYLPLPCLLN